MSNLHGGISSPFAKSSMSKQFSLSLKPDEWRYKVNKNKQSSDIRSRDEGHSF